MAQERQAIVFMMMEGIDQLKRLILMSKVWKILVKKRRIYNASRSTGLNSGRRLKTIKFLEGISMLNC